MKKTVRILVALAILVAAAAIVPHATYACDPVVPGMAMC